MVFGVGVTAKVVSTRQLKLLMKFEHNGKITTMLRKRGYVKYEKLINVENIRHNVWYKNCRKAMVNKLFRESMAPKVSGKG